MTDQDQWIIKRMGEARKLHSAVTEAVSTEIEQLLKGQLRERHVPAKELVRIAKKLISDMVPADPEAGAMQ